MTSTRVKGDALCERRGMTCQRHEDSARGLASGTMRLNESIAGAVSATSGRYPLMRGT